MRKLLRYLTTLLFLLAVGGVSSYADEQNVVGTTGTFSNSTITWTFDAFTVLQEKGTGSTSPNSSYAQYPRFYKNNTVTFTPNTGYKITQIIFTATSASNSGATFTASTGEISTSGAVTTWTGEVTEGSSLVITPGSQFRTSSSSGSVIVTYTSTSNTYVKVTDAKQLRAGNKYLIVYENGTSSKALATKDGSGNYGSSADVTVADSKITTATVNAAGSPYEVTLGGTEGAWTLSVDGQLLGNRAGAYLFYGDANAETTWVITPSTASTTIQNATNTSYFLQYNNSGSNDIFSCYGSNAVNAVSMYVLSGSSERSEASAYIGSEGTTSATIQIGKTAQISYTDGVTLSYESSDNGVATVSEDGLITGVAEGPATITASWKGTGTYLAGSQTFDITVTGSSTTGENIIFSSDYNSWANLSTSSYGTSRTLSLNASNGNAYSFTFANAQANNTDYEYLQLKKSTGTLSSSAFDFGYTVTIEYSSKAAVTLTDGTTSVTGVATSSASSSNTSTVSLDVAANGTFTLSTGSEYAIITKITITPKNGGSTTTDVTPPTISDQSDDHKVTITIPEGTTVYYTNDGSSPLSSDGKSPSGSVRQYSSGDVITLTKATTIKAVAMDADGNFSSVASKNFTYNGEVAIPYYEEFLTELGNFTVESTATSTSYESPVWETHSNESGSKWGARQYAWAQGLDEDFNALVGYTFLISPIIDLTDGGTNDFTDAYFYFEHKAGHFVSDSLKIQCTVWIRDVSDGTPGGWKQIAPSSITWPSSVTGNDFYLTNSGNISLKDYLTKKIQISFRYSHTRTGINNTGTWNVDYIYVNATKPGESKTTEVVKTNDGLVTYVTKRKIDWTATRNSNTKKDANGNAVLDSNNNLIYMVRGFKVTEFDANTVVLVELGTGAEGSEQYTPQNTPIVLKGATDDQTKHDVYLTVYDTEKTITPPEGNLLRASYNDVTAKDGERLFVMQKISGTYGWHKLKTGRTVPDRKAYLNGVDEKTKVSVTESDPLQGKYVSFDDLDNSGTSTGISSISGETNKGRHDNTFYNLQGMKVENPSHGIYIYNGRKIIIK